MNRSLTQYLLEMKKCSAEEPPHNTHLHFAAIILRGHILALARNSVLSTRHNRRDCTKHAERAVLEMVGDMSKLNGAVMFVWRVSKSSESLMSKPCKSCTCMLESVMKKWKLRKIFYTS